MPDLAHKLAQFDGSLPLEAASTIPNSWYTDPEIAQRERETVFGANWLCVGRTRQVEGAGRYLTADVAGEPILVVRGEDGVLRAFANICRHRAARVLTEPEGCATRLRCPYHGWTYGLDGSLKGVPEFDGVANFAREANGLPPLAVETWGPFVFVHPGEPRQSLADFLSPLGDVLAPFDLTRLVYYGTKSYDLECNWKVYCDNYLDGGYHVHSIHPGLAPVLDYKNYKTELHRNFSVQSAPLKAPEAGEDASAAAVRTGASAAYVWVYPNFMLNAYAGVMDTNLALPLGPDRCRVVFDFYFAEGAMTPERFGESVQVADQIQAEDVGICEDVQRGLKSRRFVAGRFSVRREAGVYHFHRLLAKQLRTG